MVSFLDSEGIEHSIRVPAESLYEAAIEAMAAFRRFRGDDLWIRNSIEDSRQNARGGTHCHGRHGNVVAGWRREESEGAVAEGAVEGVASLVGAQSQVRGGDITILVR